MLIFYLLSPKVLLYFTFLCCRVLLHNGWLWRRWRWRRFAFNGKDIALELGLGRLIQVVYRLLINWWLCTVFEREICGRLRCRHFVLWCWFKSRGGSYQLMHTCILEQNHLLEVLVNFSVEVFELSHIDISWEVEQDRIGVVPLRELLIRGGRWRSLRTSRRFGLAWSNRWWRLKVADLGLQFWWFHRDAVSISVVWGYIYGRRLV